MLRTALLGLLLFVVFVEVLHIADQISRGVPYDKLDWAFWNYFKKVKEENGLSFRLKIEPDEDCSFLTTDVIQGKLFTQSGLQIKDTDLKVQCDSCKDYVYKSNDGCSKYTQDTRYYIDDYVGICTSLEYANACPFEDSKSPPQS